MTRKVFAVSTGCYSGYAVRAIYSTRERADAFHALLKAHASHRDDLNDVEEYDLDPELPADWRPLWCAIFSPHGGEMRSISDDSFTDLVYGNPRRAGVVAFPSELDVYVRAENEDEATKAATDLVQRWRAEKAGA